MTYTHLLPNGATLTTEINTASEASIKAGLAEVARVAALVAPVSQVDVVVGEQAVAILERLRGMLGVESLGAVEAEVERLRAAFYPEPSSGKTMEVWGVVVVQGESWSLAGWNGGSLSNVQAAAWDGMNPAPKDEAFAPIYYPVAVRVPVPVDPPVLVGGVKP